jgi:hypothetical protein
MVYGTPASVGLLVNVWLGAKFETKSGKLTVYLDDAVLGTWTIDQWRYLGKAGRIGMWLHREPTGTRGPDTFDDFGGRAERSAERAHLVVLEALGVDGVIVRA